MKNKLKTFTFEPGDSLRKIASEEFSAGSAFEAKEKIKKKILESIGNTRVQLKVEASIVFQDSSNYGKSYGNQNSESFKNFDAIVKVTSAKADTSNKGKPVAALTIPIMVRDSKMNPIDTAEFMGHTFIYSPKFLKQVVDAMELVNTNPYVLDQDSSFSGVENRLTPMSDDGRLRDVLMVRNKDIGSNGWMADAPMLRRASEDLDSFLDKTASPVEFKSIEATVKQQAYKIAEELVYKEFEKAASLTEDIGARIMESASVFTQLKQMPWKKVSEVKDKAVVEIVDIDVEGENLKLKNAVVFKGISSFAGNKYGIDVEDDSFLISKSDGQLIVDEDSNYKVLRASTDMAKKYLVADTSPSFKVKAESLKTIMSRFPSDHKKLYFLFMEDGVVGPVSLTVPFDEDEVFFANSPNEASKARVGKVAAHVVRITNKDGTFNPPGRSSSGVFVLEKGIKGMKQISKDERSAILSNLFKNERHINYNVEGANLIGEDTLAICVKDFIRTPVESMTDIIFGFKSNDKSLSKIASEDKVTVEKPVPEVNKYNVLLSKGMLNKKSFKGLYRDQVVSVLKSVGVEESDAVSMVGYLDSGERTISRPAALDFAGIDGSLTESKATDMVKNFAGQMFGRPQQEELLKEIVSAQLADMLVKAPSGVFNAAASLSSLASDAEALADRFEKLAMDHRSRELQDLAKCCVATARFDRLMEKVATYNTSLDLRTARAALSGTAPLVEKCAGMLYDLKRDQTSGIELVGSNTISQALGTLQRLYTYATH